MMVYQPFPRTTPEKVGIPSKAIEAYLNNLKRSGIEMHSLMIIRHGQVCAEGWWKPYSPEKLHNVHSYTKTFVATALGMLVEEGALSLDDQVISFFPEDVPENPSENLQKMKVFHLLTMSTGQHDEPQIRGEKEFIKAFLAWPVEHEPGTWFRYNSCASHVIGRIIHRVTGKTFVEFLQERLFGKMGFGQVECALMADGFPSGGGGFALTTEDMARLAQLYLNGGVWNGEQLVPEKWIRAAIVPQCDNSNGQHRDGGEDWEAGYGYQLWMNEEPHTYRFDGAFGQEALICPEQDLAVICTASTHDLAQLFALTWRFVQHKAVDGELPENPVAWAQLKQRLDDLKLEETCPCGVSLLQDKVSGRRIALEKNDLPLFEVSLLMPSHNLKPGVTALNPVFEGDTLWLTIATPQAAFKLKAGMAGEALANTFVFGDLQLEYWASARWLDQHVLSVTIRTLRYVFTVELQIVYHLQGVEVIVKQDPHNKTCTLKGVCE